MSDNAAHQAFLTKVDRQNLKQVIDSAMFHMRLAVKYARKLMDKDVSDFECSL